MNLPFLEIRGVIDLCDYSNLQDFEDLLNLSMKNLSFFISSHLVT